MMEVIAFTLEVVGVSASVLITDDITLVSTLNCLIARSGVLRIFLIERRVQSYDLRVNLLMRR